MFSSLRSNLDAQVLTIDQFSSYLDKALRFVTLFEGRDFSIFSGSCSDVVSFQAVQGGNSGETYIVETLL